jgi:hypothetical protein
VAGSSPASTIRRSAELAAALRDPLRKRASLEGFCRDLTADAEPLKRQHPVGLDRIVETWLPLTFAVNSVLAPAVIVKLDFVHRLIGMSSELPARDRGTSTIRAILAAIRCTIGSPARP